MYKKVAALAAGIALIGTGISPVFAQVTDNSTPEIEITETSSLTIAGNSATPYGSGSGVAVALQPTSGTTTVGSGKRAGAEEATQSGGQANSQETNVQTFSTNVQGFSVTIQGDGTNSGLLDSGSDTIDAGGSVNQVTGAGVAAENTAAYEGLAFRIVQAGSTTVGQDTEDGTDGTDGFVFSTTGPVTIATKYGADTDITTRLWYLVDNGGVADATTIATMSQFVDPTTIGDNDSTHELVVDWYIAALAGKYNPGVYTETVTFSLVDL